MTPTSKAVHIALSKLIGELAGIAATCDNSEDRSNTFDLIREIQRLQVTRYSPVSASYYQNEILSDLRWEYAKKSPENLEQEGA